MSGIRDIWVYANNIIRSARQMINEALKPLGLSSAEGNILLHLLTQQQVLRQDDIVEQLDISRPAVSRAVESLERKQFITRGRDPADRRAVRVMLTDKARSLGPQIEQVYDRVFSVAASSVTEQEVREFIDLFQRVSDSFSSARSGRKVRRQINE